MRRNFKNLVKLCLISAVTGLLTVLCYHSIDKRHLKEPQTHKIVAKSVLKNERIDWHDTKFIEREANRTGPGEQGQRTYLSAVEKESKYERLFRANGFNAAVSDKIAVDRAVPDIRHKDCKKRKYLKNLPSVSVIIPFHNEHWSTLLRTLTSILNRSPLKLLKEIILVDDFSTKHFLKKPLENYIAANLTKVPVTIIRLRERNGLIRTRIAGAKTATAEVLIFLDSHIEANVNWLPPLLEPIAQDYRVCVCPFIDVIHYETFQYRAQDEGARGAFDWEFFYRRIPLLPQDLAHPAEPFKSPVMAGGLFAISARFFWELGGYDEGLDIWGGEQYELSFKIWQCGGEMYDAPCSRVGHIYRKYAPFPNPGIGDFVRRNFKRVAEVWMDEYAEYLYLRLPYYRTIDPGDLSKQKTIREKLHCKPFKWFMEEVAFDLPLKYPPIEPAPFGFGEIRNLAAPELCVDSGFGDKDHVVRVAECVKGTDRKAEQNFSLTWHKDLKVKGKSHCLDVSDPKDKASITLYNCHGGQGNQYWKYDVDNQHFLHGGNPRCLDCDPATMRLYVTKCDFQSKTQKWRFENVNLTMMAEWDSIGIAHKRGT